MSGKSGPRGRGEWVHAGRAFGRGVVFGAVLGGAGVSGLVLTAHWNPFLALAAYTLLVMIAMRVWLVAPPLLWWARGAATLGALSALVPLLLLVGVLNPLMGVIAVSFVGGIWHNAARRRPPVIDAVPAAKATWAP